MKPVLQKKGMKLAIRSVRQGIGRSEGGPFGAVIVRGGQAIAVAHNTVLKDRDATCHAEVNAIRIASRKLKRFDLSDCIIYSTTEPCPMCFSAIHWARIKKIVYGTTTADAARIGFNELRIADALLKGRSPGVKGGPRGTANGARVEPHQFSAALPEGVEIRHPGRAATPRHIAPSLIVGDDEQDVRLAGPG